MLLQQVLRYIYLSPFTNPGPDAFVKLLSSIILVSCSLQLDQNQYHDLLDPLGILFTLACQRIFADCVPY